MQAGRGRGRGGRTRTRSRDGQRGRGHQGGQGHGCRRPVGDMAVGGMPDQNIEVSKKKFKKSVG